MFGLGAVIGSALCCGVAATLQSAAAASHAHPGHAPVGVAAAVAGVPPIPPIPPVPGPVPPGSAAVSSGVTRVLREPAYLAGLALNGVSFGLSFVAARSLPLFLVQAGIAGGVGVTAVCSRVFLGAALTRRNIGLLVMLTAGLAMLAVGAAQVGGSGPGKHAVPGPEGAPAGAGVVPETISRLWEGAAGSGVLSGRALLVLALVLVTVGWRALRTRRVSGWAVAAFSGTGSAGVGLTERLAVFPHPLLRVFVTPSFWAMFLFAVASIWFFAESLRRVQVTTALTVAVVVGIVVPSAIGLLFLGDPIRPGYGWCVLIGFVLLLGAAVGIARRRPVPVGEQTGAADGGAAGARPGSLDVTDSPDGPDGPNDRDRRDRRRTVRRLTTAGDRNAPLSG